ncbi:MAG: efflux RND transporter periplasmic adaptor subunit [Bacteroidales bacterium]|nr:efflux RND transporter periplasmic adaptor subunit [Bacteroidales bacterium]MDT8429921.1 efflux RND transporter periplasmic adaptor subunit [Bacteroidales bacterium]
MKKVIVILLIAVVLAAAVFVILKYVPIGKINSGDFVISKVEVGSVVSTIPAEGTVEPESEVLILSPASSIIQRIVKDVGSRVELGEAIIILDPQPVQEEIEKIEDQLEVKRNALRKNQLNARSIRVDLDYNIEVKKLRIASLKSELADQEQLLEVGGISPARYEQTKQELVLAEKDLETVSARNSIRLQQLETEDEGLKLQIAIQEKALEQQEELLKKMIIRAPSSGIILSLDGQVGEKVNKDKLLVKMSNLSNFKIRANADDKHSEYIRTGSEVIVNLGDEQLDGQIGTVSPAIKDKKVEFDVYLDQSNHSRLRPNMTVPMHVVVARADSVLRVEYGSSFERTSNFDIYKVEGNVALKQRISTGVMGDDYMEIRSGLEPGDQVILSDVSLFRNREKVEIY